MPDKPFVSYLRVSSQTQGRSGLGMEAQRFAVAGFVRDGDWSSVGEFVEIESGKGNDRRELQRAFATCRIHGAVLIIAKLDRLSRDSVFLMSVRLASGVDILCVDAPHMGRAELGMRAVFAEEERRWISDRTKAALAAAKRRGVKLGTPENLTRRGRLKGSRTSTLARQARADQRALDLEPIIDELRAAGAASLRQLAGQLNVRKIPTARGSCWNPSQVQRILTRLLP